VDSNKTKQRKISPNGYEQASSWKRLPTIDTDQYIALIVRNNILKFHQDRITNEPPILDGSGCEKNSIFLSSLLRTALHLSPSFFFYFSSFLPQPTAPSAIAYSPLLQQPTVNQTEKFDFSFLSSSFFLYAADKGFSCAQGCT
jgi:hypothetical protein